MSEYEREEPDVEGPRRQRQPAPEEPTGKFELPAELKAFEARLASLSPRAPRFDREALIYEAGRASVLAGSDGPMAGSRRWSRWGWPASFGSMTTVAAALLVVVLIRPEPPVLVKYVRITDNHAKPAERPDENLPSATPAENLPGEPATGVLVQEDTPIDSAPFDQRRFSILAAVLGHGGDSETAPQRRRQLEVLLAQGADVPFSMATPSADNGGSVHEAAPQPYWQLREQLLQ